MRNILSVDIEEYFHPTEVQSRVGCENWDTLPSRVEAATRRVLDLLAAHRVLGTFFVLGWVAHRYPRLIREIAGAGHEIGSHGYAHRLIYELTPAQFKEDTVLAQNAIEDACGICPRVYRACSFSITSRSLWALEVLAECGFTHDSSIYPIVHDRYGLPGFGRFARMLHTPSGPIYEVPIATVQISAGRVAPVGGGAYLRLFPYRYTAAGLRRVNQEEQRPACVYFHPWELDPGQPRLAKGLLSRIRTYGNLSRMESKIQRLLSDFQFSTVTMVYPAEQLGHDSSSAAPSESHYYGPHSPATAV
jgi:polysaccharide deacetylase family protein (PEP-CTERM system associated)